MPYTHGKVNPKYLLAKICPDTYLQSIMIHHGDCLQIMSKMEPNSIDFIVTDPPYGLHFMGKNWDHGVPGITYWQEALRICKPGALLATFGGTRTHHRLMTALEDAGWEIRDVIMWVFGSGFPKSHNFGKLMEDEEWKGYGTALKPAYEPIILAMKPLDGTFKENAEKWGIAGVNIDESRILTNELKSYSPGFHRDSPSSFNDDSWEGKEEIKCPPNGRWPANIIFDEEAAQELDRQTGVLKSGGPGIRKKQHTTFSMSQLNITGKKEIGYEDSGGASRFFYCAKASSAERNRGLEGMPLKEHYIEDNPQPNRDNRKQNLISNHHPTVKPIALMKYIIKLLAPPGDPILLDPFAGSGSTIVAAKELGIRAIGIELESEYVEIAEKRLQI